jgi:hypothetical protein
VAPCVDRRRGWVFYQSNGKVWKADARDGRVLADDDDDDDDDARVQRRAGAAAGGARGGVRGPTG